MPTYVYKCNNCEFELEYIHPMSEIDVPTEDTLKDTTCCEQRMVRIPQMTARMEFSNGDKTTRETMLKKRSKVHYKKHIEERKKFMNGESKKQF